MTLNRCFLERVGTRTHLICLLIAFILGTYSFTNIYSEGRLTATLYTEMSKLVLLICLPITDCFLGIKFFLPGSVVWVNIDKTGFFASNRCLADTYPYLFYGNKEFFRDIGEIWPVT